jgi:ABC-type glycerol-3-phosphate transport system substrate-binding protein
LRKLHLLFPLALLALVLGLVACGGGESDEDKVVDVIETSATSSDPADCKELATQAFLEQTELSEGAEAVESCEESAKETEDDPDSVEVSEVEVDGSAATADAAFTGGSFDGQTLSVALIEEDGDWKLDEVTGFAEFDQEKLASTLEEGLQSGEDALDPPLARCFAEVIREVDKEEAEEIVIGGSADPIVEIIEGCTEGLEG